MNDIIKKSSLTFVRQFRYTVKFDDRLEPLAAKTKINFVDKKIRISIGEAIFRDDEETPTDYLDQWINNLTNDSKIVFTTIDGCGRSLYECTFHKLKLTSDELNFNNDSIELSSRILEFNFGNYFKTYLPDN